MSQTKKQLDPREQFPEVIDDEKLRMSLAALADNLDAHARARIHTTYNDPEIQSIYRAYRNSGAFRSGGKSKVHREVVRFPNEEVYQFVDTVMTSLYGTHWEADKRNLKHDLVRPWLLVEPSQL